MTVQIKESDIDWTTGIGLHYDSDFRIAALLNISNKNTLLSGLRSSFDLVLSANPRGQLIVERARGNRPHISLDYTFTVFTVNLLNDANQAIKTRFSQNSIKLRLNSRIQNHGLIRLGLSMDGTHICFIFSGDEAPETFNYLNLFSDYRFDNLDKVSFQSRGSKGLVLAQYLGDFSSFSESSVPQLLFDLKNYQPIGERWYLMLQAAGGSGFDVELPAPCGFYYGGLGQNYLPNFIPFSGYEFVQNGDVNSEPIRTSIMGAAVIRYQLFPDHYVHLRGNALIKAYEMKDLFESNSTDWGWSMGYGLDSPIGPVEVHGFYNRSTSGFQLYVNLGYWF